MFALIACASGLIALDVPLAPAQSCRWDGTSPLCDGACGNDETEILRLDTSPGSPPAVNAPTPPFGAACVTGTKALCCKTPGISCRWDGTAPFCDGKCQNDETQTQPPPGLFSGRSCWTGHKVYCCRRSGRTGQPLITSSIDQSFYYKLSTQFRGVDRKLDVFNGGPKDNLTRLQLDQNVSGQFWRFVADADGTFRLTTLFRGPSMCLDIFNGGPDNNQPHLANCANFSGQSWRLIENADGTFRLTTLFRGPSMCLDIFNGGPNDNQPHVTNCANFSGQLWTLSKTSKRVEN